MKKISILLLTLLVGSFLFAQERALSFDSKRNELKLNIAKSVFSFPEISYEYIFNQNMSLGVSLGVGLQRKTFLSYNYMLTPYYRWFFTGSGISSDKRGTGFFLEANSALFSERMYYDPGVLFYSITPIWDNAQQRYVDTKIEYADDGYEKTVLGLGLGAALGFKHVHKGYWLSEIFIGIGNNFRPFKDEHNNNQLYPHFGLNIGKRF